MMALLLSRQCHVYGLNTRGSDSDDDDDNFIAIYMYITRHTCNGMRAAA